MRYTPFPTTLLLFLVLAAAMPTRALAQSTEVRAALGACLDIEQDEARLACLEAIAVRESTSAEPSRAGASDPPSTPPAGPIVEDRRAARTVARPEPRDDSGRAAADEGRTARSVTIVDARELARGNMRFVTDDGEVFVQMQINGPQNYPYPPVPFAAEIVEASMGSFFLRAEGGPRGVRVRQVSD